MQKKIRFVRSRKDDQPRGIAQPGFNVLATLLESDIQDHGTGTEIIKEMTQAMGKTTYETSGNSCSLLLDIEGMVIIESLFDEEATPVELGAEEFLHYLRKWMEFIETPALLCLMP